MYSSATPDVSRACIGWKVPRAVGDRRPVQELGAGVTAVVHRVEQVEHGDRTQGQNDALAGVAGLHLILLGLLVLHLSVQVEGLPEKRARVIEG